MFAEEHVRRKDNDKVWYFGTAYPPMCSKQNQEMTFVINYAIVASFPSILTHTAFMQSSFSQIFLHYSVIC